MPGKSPLEVEQAIDSLLDQVKTKAVAGRELQKAKTQIESTFIMRQDSIFGQAMRIGRYEIAAGWHLKDYYLGGIKNLTAADLLRVARQYLQPDRRTIGILIPIKENGR
jgi:zinc protease